MRSITRNQLIAIGILAGLNFLLSGLVMGDGRRLNGELVEAHSPEMRRATFTTLFFGIQAIGFVLGALLAVIPYKGMPYHRKGITLSLFIALGLQGAFFLLAVARLTLAWL